MLYKLLKIPAKLAFLIYCRHIRITHKEALQSKGPLLLACNHPNSFLDAIILATLFRQPVYSLARGDAFKKNWVAWLLKQLNILPVYREKEGAELLLRNYHTFDACIEIFKKGGIVLIFSEALCENEWHLRPLRKGTARLAWTAWQQQIPLRILPVGINYSSFHLFGKNVHLHFGNFISARHEPLNGNENGKLLNEITSEIREQLHTLVYEINERDKQTQAAKFEVPISKFKQGLLLIPAIVGYIIHFPLYFPIKKIITPLTFKTGHYDAVMTGLLFLLYPLYLALLCVLAAILFPNYWWIAAWILIPFSAWSCVQLMQQTDK